MEIDLKNKGNKMTEELKDIILKIGEIGYNRFFIDAPDLCDVNPFIEYFDEDKQLKIDELDVIDGSFTRREILTRYLLLNATVDQGPDIGGVRMLLNNILNLFYQSDIKILHEPSLFFNNLHLFLDKIIEEHEKVKEIRKYDWAESNNSNPNRYNLFFAQSARGIVSTKQVLSFVIHRWGTPLSVPIMLAAESKESTQPLVEYLESSGSSELMSVKIKSDEKYGLGNAIGDKACHLFAKWYVNTFKLSTKEDSGWSKWSYEVPFDSNVGRVLFRTGFLQKLASIDDYKRYDVIQGDEENPELYIRVTNIREKGVKKYIDEKLKENYYKIVLEHLQTNQRKPRKLQIQIIPNAILLNSEYGIGDFDDGVLYIGTKFCYNHDNPLCEQCPINEICESTTKPEWITDYHT